MGRVIVFGMDGADPDLLFPWARDGHLPHLRSILERGAHGRLESTIHPLTPQAWTTMTTGVNAGRHGIFDFGAREPGSYDVRLVTSRDRRFPTIFETLPDPFTSGALNVPLSYPVADVRGFAVGGMHTPSLNAPGAFYPPDLRSVLERWVIDVMVHWYEDRARFCDDLFAMLNARHEAALAMFDERKPDLFFPVYVALDRAQHAFWEDMTAEHRATPGALGGFGDAIFETARRLDACVGDYLARLGPDDHMLVVSDHGFGDLRGDVYLNAFLAEAGYLAFDPDKIRAAAASTHSPPDGIDPRHAWHRRLDDGRAPEPLPDDDGAIRRGLVDARYKSWATVDWSRTRAFSSGLFGQVWINLAGREPEGIVAPGREYEELRDELAPRLADLVHPGDGAPLTSFVARREELYWGPHLECAPDIVVAFRDYAYMTRGATEFRSTSLVGPVVVGHTGNHRLHGIVAGVGPRIANARDIDAHILEIAPTILYLLDAPIPMNLDAPPARALLREDALAEHPPRAGAPVAARVIEARDAPTAAQMTAVLDRLRGLGYLG
ncbi:alkaline phosphatase family protein [bacterium]|nr:alkaline phosphatase family protein [bacterium]